MPVLRGVYVRSGLLRDPAGSRLPLGRDVSACRWFRAVAPGLWACASSAKLRDEPSVLRVHEEVLAAPPRRRGYRRCSSSCCKSSEGGLDRRLRGGFGLAPKVRCASGGPVEWSCLALRRGRKKESNPAADRLFRHVLRRPLPEEALKRGREDRLCLDPAFDPRIGGAARLEQRLDVYALNCRTRGFSGTSRGATHPHTRWTTGADMGNVPHTARDHSPRLGGPRKPRPG